MGGRHVYKKICMCTEKSCKQASISWQHEVSHPQWRLAVHIVYYIALRLLHEPTAAIASLSSGDSLSKAIHMHEPAAEVSCSL